MDFNTLNTVSHTRAFTLSELLISISVLGLIAALSIPTVFNATESSKRKALFKDTISTLQDAYYGCVLDGECYPGEYREFFKKINAVKICAAGDTSCTTNTSIPNENTADENSGFIMFNGAYVWGFQTNRPWPTDGFLVDYNGLEAPNLMGTDIIYMIRCYDEETNGAACSEMTAARSGQIAVNTTSTISVELYNKLFK